MEFFQLLISMGPDNKNIVDVPTPLLRFPGEVSRAVHSWTKQHQVDWEAAKTIEVEGNYWRKRVSEALHIHHRQQTSNLDCG